MMTRAKLACGQKAIAMGFSEIAGYHMYEGIMADDINKWNRKTFLTWSHSMDRMFTNGSDEQIAKLLQLYDECSKILSQEGIAFND